MLGCAKSFFKLLRKSGPFVWSNNTEEAFQELKRYLTSAPVMVAPQAAFMQSSSPPRSYATTSRLTGSQW
jgi:hypothetical protein